LRTRANRAAHITGLHWKTARRRFFAKKIIDKLKGNDEAPEIFMEYVSGQLNEYPS